MVVGAFVSQAIVAIIRLRSISAIEPRSSLVGKDIVFRLIIELKGFWPPSSNRSIFYMRIF
jgi:hypothetical protein